MPSSQETPDPENIPLLESLREAYRVKQEVTDWYRDTLTRALAAGISTAVIARYVGVTPQAISTARIRLWPKNRTKGEIPEPRSLDDIVRVIQQARTTSDESDKAPTGKDRDPDDQ